MGAEFCKRLFLYLLRLSYDLSFHFINVMYHTDWCTYVELSLHPKAKFHFVMVHDSLTCCWIWFTSILLRIFSPIGIRILVLVFSSGRISGIWLWYQDNAGLIKWVWEFSFTFNFLKEFWEGLALFVLQVFDKIHQWSHLILVFLSWEIFDYSFNLLTSNWSILIFHFFLIQSWLFVYF